MNRNKFYLNASGFCDGYRTQTIHRELKADNFEDAIEESRELFENNTTVEDLRKSYQDDWHGRVTVEHVTNVYISEEYYSSRAVPLLEKIVEKKKQISRQKQAIVDVEKLAAEKAKHVENGDLAEYKRLKKLFKETEYE
jgi:hypothetical protein